MTEIWKESAMTDRYKKIREALALGPTPGPWLVCPDTIRELLEERDGLAAENEVLRAERDELRKTIDRAWNEGFDFAMKSCGWQEGEDPTAEGLYVVRDSRGNVEVGMWYAKTTNSQPAEWTREFRDVDRDDIVAWMAIPD